MTEFSQWLSIAEKLGLGATFILGIACWKLWNVFNGEREYSRTRDKETLTVVSQLTKVLDNQQTSEVANTEKILSHGNHNHEALIRSMASMLERMEKHSETFRSELKSAADKLEQLVSRQRH